MFLGCSPGAYLLIILGSIDAPKITLIGVL